MPVSTLKYLIRLYERTRKDLLTAIKDRGTIEEAINSSGGTVSISEKFPEYYITKEKIAFNEGVLWGVKTAITTILENDEIEHQ